jgi:hypothetical protein
MLHLFTIVALLSLGSQARIEQSGVRTTSAIDGVVTDTALAPLQDASILVVGSTAHAMTGATGRFRMSDLPPGEYILLAHRIGFEPVSARVQVADGETVRMSLYLDRISTHLDTVKVSAPHRSARLADFDARRRAGFGLFMTADEIAKRNIPWASNLFIMFQGVNVVTQGRTSVAIDRREGAGCAMPVILDGIPVSTNLEELPPPSEIAGIEVYLGPATIPLQYKRRRMPYKCGLILVWTKDGT